MSLIQAKKWNLKTDRKFQKKCRSITWWRCRTLGRKERNIKTAEERFKIATDPLNLIAVQAAANQQKSDSDAATWLPKNKSFRCQYVARQISVKYKYLLWVTEAEKEAMGQILEKCPEQRSY